MTHLSDLVALHQNEELQKLSDLCQEFTQDLVWHSQKKTLNIYNNAYSHVKAFNHLDMSITNKTTFIKFELKHKDYSFIISQIISKIHPIHHHTWTKPTSISNPIIFFFNHHFTYYIHI